MMPDDIPTESLRILAAFLVLFFATLFFATLLAIALSSVFKKWGSVGLIVYWVLFWFNTRYFNCLYYCIFSGTY